MSAWAQYATWDNINVDNWNYFALKLYRQQLKFLLILPILGVANHFTTTLV